jgi:hypothetical protein
MTRKLVSKSIQRIDIWLVSLWRLTPLSPIFHLYRGGRHLIVISSSINNTIQRIMFLLSSTIHRYFNCYCWSSYTQVFLTTVIVGLHIHKYLLVYFHELMLLTKTYFNKFTNVSSCYFNLHVFVPITVNSLNRHFPMVSDNTQIHMKIMYTYTTYTISILQKRNV